MDTPSSSTRELARRLLAASQTASAPRVPAAERVSEKLRMTLTRFAGPEGFASLLRRALALARTEVPALQGVKIGSDGQLEGFEQLVADGGAAGDEAAVALTAQLLGLLETFVGKSFMLKLVREAWPDAVLDEEHSSKKAGS